MQRDPRGTIIRPIKKKGPAGRLRRRSLYFDTTQVGLSETAVYTCRFPGCHKQLAYRSSMHYHIRSHDWKTARGAVFCGRGVDQFSLLRLSLAKSSAAAGTGQRPAWSGGAQGVQGQQRAQKARERVVGGRKGAEERAAGVLVEGADGWGSRAGSCVTVEDGECESSGVYRSLAEALGIEERTEEREEEAAADCDKSPVQVQLGVVSACPAQAAVQMLRLLFL